MTSVMLITAMLAIMSPAPPPALIAVDVTGLEVLQNGHILLMEEGVSSTEVRALPDAMLHWLEVPPSGTTRCTILLRPDAVSELLGCAGG